MEKFMSANEWEEGEKFDGREPILRWKDLEEKKLFCLTSIENKTNPTQKFETYILHFTDRAEESYKAFCPSHFLKQIRRNRELNMRPYFVSHGLFEKGGNSIAQFEITYKAENKTWDLFDHHDPNE